MFQVQQHKANEWVSVSIDFKSIDPALRNTRRVGGIWRIIRIADNVVIAQSKNAPADTSTSTPETVASAAPAVAAPAVAAQAEPVADTRAAIKAWLFAEREGVTGHGRKPAKKHRKGHKRVKSPKNGAQVMMQRKTPQIEEIKANYAIAQSEYRRQREIEMAEAIENARRVANINQQMSGVYGTVPSGGLLGQAA